MNSKWIIPLLLLSTPCFARIEKINDQSISNGLPYAKKYVIKNNINLQNRTIHFPDSSILEFRRGGCISNGTIDGKIYIRGVRKGSIDAYLTTNSEIFNNIPLYSTTPRINATIISACTGGASLKEDIIIESSVRIRSTIEGNGYRIVSNEPISRLIEILDNHNNIDIKNLTISLPYSDGKVAYGYAVFGQNSSNITIQNCIINGRICFLNNTQSDDVSDISSNIRIIDSKLNCNLSNCIQDWKYEQDHISLISIKDVMIKNCEINSTDVNRVLKTTAYFAKAFFEEPHNCTNNIVFTNNTINATCRNGKQLWDMFCGTVNVQILENRITADGFVVLFEDKANQEKKLNDTLINSIIRIAHNIICTSNSALFSFHGSTVCDNFVVENNTFTVGGSNLNEVSKNTRHSGVYLQSYKSCLITRNQFIFKDEAVGLPFATMNFNCKKTIVADNIFTDAYRINVSSTQDKRFSADSLIYINNTKVYTNLYKSPKIELSFEGCCVGELYVDIPHNNNQTDFSITFNDNTSINNLTYKTRSTNNKAFVYVNNSVNIRNMEIQDNIIRANNAWYLK